MLMELTSSRQRDVLGTYRDSGLVPSLAWDLSSSLPRYTTVNAIEILARNTSRIRHGVYVHTSTGDGRGHRDARAWACMHGPLSGASGPKGQGPSTNMEGVASFPRQQKKSQYDITGGAHHYIMSGAG